VAASKSQPGIAVKNKSAVVAACLSLFAQISMADQPGPTVLLATDSEVRAACEKLPQSGITCIDAGSPVDPAGLGPGSISMSRSDYFLFDQSDQPAVKGFLVLTKLSTAAGNAYYSAVPVMFKTGFARIGWTQTDLYYSKFWDSMKGTLNFHLPNSDVTNRYLAGMDEQISAEKAAADRKAALNAAREEQRAVAAATAASEAAYQATPQYARDQAKRAVEQCRSDISRARAAIAKDDRIAQISGYQNALLRRQAASIIVNCEDTIARNGK
jgi:hypothetical protein